MLRPSQVCFLQPERAAHSGQHLASAPGYSENGAAGKGAGVKNSPLEGRPALHKSARPTAEQRHLQDYQYGD